MNNFETLCYGFLVGDGYKDWEGSTCVIYFTLVSLLFGRVIKQIFKFEGAIYLY